MGLAHVSMQCMHAYTYILDDLSGLRALTKANVVPYGTAMDNTFLRHIFSEVWFPARAWPVIVFPIGLTLWSGRLPPQLHDILAQILTNTEENV